MPATNADLGAAGVRTYETVHFDYEPDHVGVMISQLPGHLRDKPRIRAWIRAKGLAIQRAEDTIFAILEELLLPVSTGVNLERWGNFVGEPRGSLVSDREYRAIITARIRANRCDGSLDAIMEVLSEAAEPVVCLEYFPKYPGGFKVVATRESFMSEARRARVRSIMSDVTPSGRDARFVEALVGGEGPPTACASNITAAPLARTI